ncbi:MAG TPA: hypothetical protein DEA08_23570 [Planctomycetes bacterium]|nr:hypothetical protein [Planctomycetota bacterium]
MNGQAEGLLRRKARPLTYPLPTLAVTSARRGSGATTVARNVAASLTAAGQRAALLDLSGRAPGGAVADLSEALAGRATLRECLRRGPAGIELGGLGVPQALTSEARGGQLLGLLDVLRAEVDALVVDLPADAPLTGRLLEAADLGLVVADKDPADVTASYALFKRLAAPRASLGLCLNRVEETDAAQRVGRGIQEVCRRFLAWEPDLLPPIPQDSAVREAARRGLPLRQAAPSSAAHVSFSLLGRAVRKRFAAGPRVQEGVYLHLEGAA